MKALTLWAAMAGLVALAAGPAAAGAADEGPQAAIRATTDAILATLKDPALKPPEKKAERREKILAAVNARFQWPEMSQRALGRHWRARSDDERKQFIPLFAEIVRNTYLARVEAYEGEQVVYKGERVEGHYARVSVHVVTTKHTTIPIIYSLKRFDDQWLIYDFSIEGVRIVNNYRRQFDNLLNRGSFAQLIEKLKAKVEAMAKDL